VPHLHPGGFVHCHFPGAGCPGCGSPVGMGMARGGGGLGRGPPGQGPPGAAVPPAAAAQTLDAAPAPGPSAAPSARRRRLAQAPTPAGTPYEAIAADPSLSLARALLDRAGAAADAAKGTGNLTILAPTDASLRTLFVSLATEGRAPASGGPAGAVEAAPQGVASRVVQMHTVPGVRLSSLPQGEHTLQTAAGTDVIVYIKSPSSAPRVTDAARTQDAEVVGTLHTRAGGEVAVLNGAIVPPSLVKG